MNTAFNLPQLIAFDFDGVVLESFQVKTDAFYRLLLPYGQRAAEQAVAHHTANGGVSRFVKIPLYFRDYAGIPLTDAQVEEKCREYAALVEEAVIVSPPVAGIELFLQQLEAAGCPCAVVTGTPLAEMERILDAIGYRRYFRAVYGSPDDKLTLFRRLLAEFRLVPDQLLFFGDSINDWDPAEQLGIPFIGRAADPASHPFPEGVPVIRDFLDNRLDRLRLRR